MKSKYELEHQGLKVSMEFDADDTWINHSEMMDSLSNIIKFAECCEKEFKLSIVQKEFDHNS
jgi:hypothetical protein